MCFPFEPVLNFCRLVELKRFLIEHDGFNLLNYFTEEFSLKIVDLQLEDDNRYQCQVMWTEEHQGIVSQYAWINVLSKCIKPLSCPLSFSDALPHSLEFHILNSFLNKPWFLRVCITILFKTLWEKEKLPVTSNFSFSHSVFYPFGDHSTTFIKFKIVVCNLFEFGRV